MPLVPSVTELIIAQLLYLNYQNDNIITIYLNSPGTNSPDGRAFSFDTEGKSTLTVHSIDDNISIYIYSYVNSFLTFNTLNSIRDS